MLHTRSIVLCVGIKASASTWLYNVVAEMLRAGRKAGGRGAKCRPPALLQFYADSVSAFPPRAAAASHLVVKSHIPDTGMEILTRFSAARVILTIREPRDAVASVMGRFGHRFEKVLPEVAEGSARIVDFKKAFGPAVLRYEDGFHARLDTLEQLAGFLALRLSRGDYSRIFEQHTPAAVERRITRFKRTGAYGHNPTPDHFHPRTHWHPGHVGDGKTGKFEAALSRRQQQAVLAATAEYCKAFGY